MSSKTESSFFETPIKRGLTIQELREIAEFFRFLNVCGECGKWFSILFNHLGICMEDYMNPKKDFVKKACAWCFGCEKFVYWKEYAWHSPTKDQFEIIIETKKLLFQKGKQWAKDLILPKFDYVDDIEWHLIFSQLLAGKETQNTIEKEIDEIYTQTDEEDEELSDQEEGFIDDNLLEEEE